MAGPGPSPGSSRWGACLFKPLRVLFPASCFFPPVAFLCFLATVDRTAKEITKSGREAAALKKQPRVLQVNNSIGPHYGGNGLNHGIQIQNGPHKGRLAFAERFDCPGVDESAPYWRSYVLYSDDEGRTWTTGQLLPEGWTGKSKRTHRPVFLFKPRRPVGLT